VHPHIELRKFTVFFRGFRTFSGTLRSSPQQANNRASAKDKETFDMRSTDARYRRDRLRQQVAVHFLMLEARTHTIQAWTGLSADSIRRLYKVYVTHKDGFVPRHRGKSPQQAGYFWSSIRMEHETTWLASLLALLGVISPGAQESNSSAFRALTRGRLLCKAFDTYRALVPSAQISFEHTIFLAIALDRGDRVRLAICADCGTLIVRDSFLLRHKRCHYCERE
jgi:hypothetical protein